MARGDGDTSVQLARIDANVRQLLDVDRDHEIRIRAVESRTDHTAQLASIGAQLTALDAKIAASDERVDTKLAGVDDRLRGVDRWRWLVSGAFAAGGTGLGAALTAFLGG